MQIENNIMLYLHKMQTKGVKYVMMILSKENQRKLLIGMAVCGMNRKKLATAIGISIPTTRKILTEEAPIAVSNKTYTLVQKWIISISRKE